MTKNEANAQFIQMYPELVKDGDRATKSLVWGTYTDTLCKNGEITMQQYQNWRAPAWIRK